MIRQVGGDGFALSPLFYGFLKGLDSPQHNVGAGNEDFPFIYVVEMFFFFFLMLLLAKEFTIMQTGDNSQMVANNLLL